MTDEPTEEEFLNDFRARCRNEGNLEQVKEGILKNECPFPRPREERTTEFRRERRFYRKHPELREKLLGIIEEIRK